MLVHCYAGQSRSVALMLAYLCSALHMRLADAFQLVLHARPSACPNSGRALCNYACPRSDSLSSIFCSVNCSLEAARRQDILSRKQ